MRVVVVGTGYVGLGTVGLLAQIGHEVTGVDIDPEKIAALRAGQVPIYEPGLGELLASNAARIRWSLDYAAVEDADVVFICVGTPATPGGAPDLRYVTSAAISIARHLSERPQVIVNKSTVPIGTGDFVSHLLGEHGPRYHPARHWVVSNPEFLREGTALADSLYPDRIVLGGPEEATERMKLLYAPLLNQTFGAPPSAPRPAGFRPPPVVTTTLTSAEMIKYAANAFLALKISYANEIAGLCERVGADVQEVALGIGLDGRIGQRFLQAGAGWGGSCFGKDISALISAGQEYGYAMPILAAAVQVNTRQRQFVIEKVQKHLRVLKGKRVAVLGLSFKPNTDDLRDAPAHDFIEHLTRLGAVVVAHDPVAMPRAEREWAHLDYRTAPSACQAVARADAVIIATEWEEYRHLDWEALARTMRRPIVIDARNLLGRRVPGLTVEQIGRELALEAAL